MGGTKSRTPTNDDDETAGRIRQQRMDRQYILDEIRRTAEENGVKPLGRERFATETGIRVCDWEGKYWARWERSAKQVIDRTNWSGLLQRPRF